MKFPLSFIEAAQDYVIIHNLDPDTACLVASEALGLNIFSSKPGRIRWTSPGMRDLENEGGIYPTYAAAVGALKSMQKTYKQDEHMYPDAKVILVKDLKS